MIAICSNTSVYLGVTIFALVRSCRRVGRLETTRFLSATRVGVWIAVASGTFLFLQGAFWLSLGSNMVDLCSNTIVYVGFTFFVLYRPWIPGEHRRGICAVVCVAAHLHGFEEDSRSEVVFCIDEWSTAFSHHGLDVAHVHVSTSASSREWRPVAMTLPNSLASDCSYMSRYMVHARRDCVQSCGSHTGYMLQDV